MFKKIQDRLDKILGGAPSFQGSALERTAFEAPPRVSHAFTTQEGKPTAVNMFPSSSLNQSVTREGEAPAEPWRPQLGKSLALPKVFKRVRYQKMFTGVGQASGSVRPQGTSAKPAEAGTPARYTSAG